MHIYLRSPSNHISSGQDGGCILHYWDTFTQPSGLHSEKCRSQKCHEKVMVQQTLTQRGKEQKMLIVNSVVHEIKLNRWQRENVLLLV